LEKLTLHCSGSMCRSFRGNKLDDDGTPTEPRAAVTGSDLSRTAAPGKPHAYRPGHSRTAAKSGIIVGLMYEMRQSHRRHNILLSRLQLFQIKEILKGIMWRVK
jgi:hypothetical protein